MTSEQIEAELKQWEKLLDRAGWPYNVQGLTDKQRLYLWKSWATEWLGERRSVTVCPNDPYVFFWGGALKQVVVQRFDECSTLSEALRKAVEAVMESDGGDK